ncbi:MAG: glycosyltransferase family 9 protein [Candidatus Methylomirabilis sp.]|nr:glycosyltransferase family 9 protein [Deltaproteobacteria bacterium]
MTLTHILGRPGFFARTFILSGVSELQARAHALHEKAFPVRLDASEAKILFIQLGQIGDYALSEPFLKALKSFPGKVVRITALIDPVNYELCKAGGAADEMVLYGARKYTRGRPSGFPAALLDEHKFDCAVWLRGDLKVLFWLIRKGVRFVSVAKYPIPLRRACFALISKRPAGKEYPHFTECLERLLKELFPGARMRAQERLQDVRHSDKRIYIHIGSGNRLRRWPEERFAELCRMLLESDRALKICLLGSEADRKDAGAILGDKRLLSYAERIEDLSGRVGLPELKRVLSNGALFIGFDSGPMHIAASSGISVVALMGPQSPMVFGPRGTGNTRVVYKAPFCSPCWQFSCIRNDGGAGECVLAITPGEVFRAAVSLLQKAQPAEKGGTHENAPCL